LKFEIYHDCTKNIIITSPAGVLICKTSPHRAGQYREGPALPQLLLLWVMPWQQGITPQTSGSPPWFTGCNALLPGHYPTHEQQTWICQSILAVKIPGKLLHCSRN